MTTTTPLHNIRIGTIVPSNAKDYIDYMRQAMPHGFECFQISFSPFEDLDFQTLAKRWQDLRGDQDVKVSSFFLGANPMGDKPEDELALRSIEKLIDNAKLFDMDVVAAFTGRVRGASIPDSMERFVEIWEPLVKRAADNGVRIAFENCSMGGNWETGDWNIAHCPKAWEMIFDALPYENLGLEWEPCHQMVLLMDPMPQLRQWTEKIFHVHGKDATIHWDVVRQYGFSGGVPFAHHRTPGFGDSNWTEIISELRRHGYQGTIDIEGWHDPVYVGELEATGQVYALEYLKHARGGKQFIQNFE